MKQPSETPKKGKDETPKKGKDADKNKEANVLEAIISNDFEKRIAEAFSIFDHIGNKTVDVREIGTILRSLGCVPSEAEIQEIIVSVEDQENAGTVHLFKFLPHVASLISEYKMQPASAEELLKAFQTMDKDGKGYLTREFLEKALLEEGEPFTKEEVDEMMATAVDSESGNINYEYYINQILVNVEPNIYSLIPNPDEEEEAEASKPQSPEKPASPEKDTPTPHASASHHSIV